MRFYFVIFFLIIIFSMYLNAKDWRQVHPFIKFQYVQAINCPDSNNCFALFNHPGQAIEEAGWRLYKSTNQGYSWELKYRAKNIYEQEDPQIFNVAEGLSPHPYYYYVASDDGAILIKSTDGGTTFKKIILDSSNEAMFWELNDLAMYDTLTGFATDRANYFTTKDGWETFNKYPKLNTDQTYYSPLFMDSNTVVMTYHARLAWNDGKGVAFVKYTINENKWDTLFYFERNPSIYFDLVKSFHFINDTVGFGCGYRSDTALPDGRYYDIIYRTTDGGKDWKLIFKEYNYPWVGFYNNISFHDENNGIAVGYRGKVAMTNDGGETWVYNPLPEEWDHCRKMRVCWAGLYPLIGTWDAGIFRYEGNFFGLLPPDTTVNLISTIPEPGTEDVSIDTEIYAKFNDILDTGKFNYYSYTLQNQSNSNEYIQGTYNYNFSDSTLRFTPDSALPYSSVINVNLYNIYDIAGNVLSEYSYTFTTEPDTTDTTGVNDYIKHVIGDINISILHKSSKLYVAIEDELFRKYKFQLCDIMGNIIFERELQSGIGTLYKPIDVTGISNGAYLYMICTGGVVVKTGKLILINN
jgi:hypothetical protein